MQVEGVDGAGKAKPVSLKGENVDPVAKEFEDLLEIWNDPKYTPSQKEKFLEQLQADVSDKLRNLSPSDPLYSEWRNADRLVRMVTVMVDHLVGPFTQQDIRDVLQEQYNALIGKPGPDPTFQNLLVLLDIYKRESTFYPACRDQIVPILKDMANDLRQMGKAKSADDLQEAINDPDSFWGCISQALIDYVYGGQ